MSVRVMSWVFAHSTARGVDRLVLLAIADCANDHGYEAWPSLTTLADKCGVDRRTVSRSLARLIDLGELERVRSGGLTARGGVSNSYRVLCVDPQRQGQSAPRGVSPLGATSPEVGAESPESGGSVPQYPSRTTPNHPRSAAEFSTAPPAADFEANTAAVRSLRSAFRDGRLTAVDEPRNEGAAS